MGFFPSVPFPSLNVLSVVVSWCLMELMLPSQLLRASTAYLYIPFKTWKINMLLEILASVLFIHSSDFLFIVKFSRTNSPLPFSSVNVQLSQSEAFQICMLLKHAFPNLYQDMSFLRITIIPCMGKELEEKGVRKLMFSVSAKKLCYK